ncbi:hypothetical protein B0H11DRAFT_1936146 [Mycena galericulata]|nr:hypothetical protein B0H11DRAFT_1936146 [Mycena galericulata]
MFLALSSDIIGSTIHIQDFQDRDGYKKAGRRILPIIFPVFSRYASFSSGHSYSVMSGSLTFSLNSQWSFWEQWLGWLFVAFSLPIYCKLMGSRRGRNWLWFGCGTNYFEMEVSCILLSAGMEG